MSIRRILPLVLVLAGCTAPKIPNGRIVCDTADDCPTDFVCRANRCWADGPSIMDSGLSDASSTDSGATDSGATDSGSVDAGTDSGSPDASMFCTTGDFTTTTTLVGLDTTDNEFVRSVSPDENVVYFHAKRTGDATVDLWTATRLSAISGYTSYAKLPFSSVTEDDSFPAVNADATLVVFARFNAASSSVDLANAGRATSGASWPSTSNFIGATPMNESGPFVSSAGNLYFTYQSQLWVAAANGGGPSTPVLVPGLTTTTGVSSPVVDSTETILYYSVDSGAVGAADIHYATRATTGDPFVPQGIVPLVNSSANDYAAHLSANGCRLYLTSNRTTGHAFDGFVATRTP